MKFQGIVGLAVIACAAAACGGGGGGGGSTGPSSTVLPSAAPTVAASTVPAGDVVAKVAITIPQSSTSASTTRQAKNIGAGTQSITFTLLELNGAAAAPNPQTFLLTLLNPNCSLVGPNLVCNLALDVPVGSDILLAQTYTGLAGNGNLTGSGAVNIQIVANKANTASITLNGQVATVYLASSNFYLGTYPSAFSAARRNNPDSAARRVPAGAEATPPPLASMQIFVIALDNQNNIIINPSVFDQSIYLQLVYPGGTPNVTLQVVPGSEGGATTSVSANYASVAVNSPTDAITASIIPNISNSATGVVIVGNIGSPLLTCCNPIPTNPAPPVVPLTVTELPFASGTLVLYDQIQSNGCYGGPYGLPCQSVTALNWTSLSCNSLAAAYGCNGANNDNLFIYEYGFNGNYNITDPTCTAINLTLNIVQFGPYGAIAPSAAQAGSCTATFDDGMGNTLTIPITITTTSVIGQ